MKGIKNTILSGMLLLSAGAMVTSCSDWLELTPIDNYGSSSYWKTEAQVKGYVDGIHKHLRDATWQHTITFGELRGGAYKDGSSADGNSLNDGTIRLQNFDKVNTGVKKFGDIFGRITNLNLFIARVKDATFLDEAKKNFYLGQVYGLRAFYYFDLYRVYGGVPLRLTVDVIDGVLDPNLLYMARSTPKEVMAQIKSDLDESLRRFGDMNSFDPYSQGKKVYWSKAATECLLGEVYLWTSKVTTGDDAANPADLAVAKRHLTNVVNNYGLKLLANFGSVFDAKNKANDEIIFAVRYAEGEATNNNSSFTYNTITGSTSKNAFLADGTVFGDPFQIKSSGAQWYEYNPLIYKMYDAKDIRRDATFLASYSKSEAGELELRGTHVRKNIGYLNSQGAQVYCGDYVFYRLSWVYLTLAEVANMEGDNAGVEKYINTVRERALPYYKDEAKTQWEKDLYGYTAGDFTQNELAILQEKDKEFVQEGQRWWDIRRMTLTKGGKPLVFCKESSLDSKYPILNEEKEAYKVLWPIEQTMIDKDPSLKQTPGYEDQN